MNCQLKRQVIVLLLGMVLLGPFGCNNTKNGLLNTKDSENQFPSLPVGSWKADNAGWELNFDDAGAITAMKHYFVSVPIDMEQRGAYEQLRGEAYGIYLLGPCTAQFEPATRELKVKIIMDHFRVELPIGVGEGTMTDTLTGPVGPQGKTWEVNWHSLVQFEDVDTVDPNGIKPKPLTFTRIESK